MLSTLDTNIFCILDPGEEPDKLYEELCGTHQSHLPVYTAMMASLESDAHKEWPSSEKRIAPAVLQRIIAIAVSYTHLDVYKRQMHECP